MYNLWIVSWKIFGNQHDHSRNCDHIFFSLWLRMSPWSPMFSLEGPMWQWLLPMAFFSWDLRLSTYTWINTCTWINTYTWINTCTCKMWEWRQNMFDWWNVRKRCLLRFGWRLVNVLNFLHNACLSISQLVQPIWQVFEFHYITS